MPATPTATGESARPRALAALAALALVAIAFLAGRAAGGDRGALSAGGAFELVPVNPGGPPGLADLGRAGGRITGRLVVWGLAPGSAHAVQLRGPGGACPRSAFRGAAARPARGDGATSLGVLTADPNGVGFLRVDAPAGGRDVDAEHAVLVHERERPDSPVVACAAGAKRAGVAPADVSSAGPGGGARAAAGTIVQVVGGRPVGGVQELRLHRGDTVALALRADRPDELRLAGYGLAIQVGPGTTPRLTLRLDRSGRFVLRGRVAGGPPLAVLVVR